MNSSIDDGWWTGLTAAWREREEEVGVHPAELYRAVTLESERMRRWLLIEILLSVAALGIAWWFVTDHVGPRPTVLARDTLAILAIVWAFALWGRRGLWTPAAETSHAYLVLSRRRARLKLLTAWLALVLVLLQLVVAVWVGAGNRNVTIAAAVAWALWSVWMRRRSIREMGWYDALLRDSSDAE